MIRFTPPLYFIALTVFPAFAGEEADSTVTLDNLTFNVDKLKEWGTKRYTHRLVQPDGTLSTKGDDDAASSR